MASSAHFDVPSTVVDPPSPIAILSADEHLDTQRASLSAVLSGAAPTWVDSPSDSPGSSCLYISSRPPLEPLACEVESITSPQVEVFSVSPTLLETSPERIVSLSPPRPCVASVLDTEDSLVGVRFLGRERSRSPRSSRACLRIPAVDLPARSAPVVAVAAAVPDAVAGQVEGQPVVVLRGAARSGRAFRWPASAASSEMFLFGLTEHCSVASEAVLSEQASPATGVGLATERSTIPRPFPEGRAVGAAASASAPSHSSSRPARRFDPFDQLW